MGPDVTRPTQASALQLELTLHVPYDFDAHLEDVEAKDVRTLVRCSFANPDARTYTNLELLCTLGVRSSAVDELDVIIHAHAVDRHLGDAADLIEYEIHLSEASAPVVMFLGVVDGLFDHVGIAFCGHR